MATSALTFYANLTTCDSSGCARYGVTTCSQVSSAQLSPR